MNNHYSDDFNDKIAKSVSYLCEAPILAIFVFLIFNLSLDYSNLLLIESISLIFGTIFPILFVVSWSKYKEIDRDYTDRHSRHFPFIIAVIIYLTGAIVLWFLNANPLTTALMFCYGTNTLIVFFINLKWKISVHAMGVTGPATALIFFNPLGFLMGLIAPLVMWSRVVLSKHSPNQVLAGSICGYLLTFIQMYILLNVMNFKISIYLAICLILGLILISIVSYLALRKNSH
ncbi:phosphatase PAP2 family protein [Methanobrevibacter olleyae]|uniref:PAP2 superfamily protein n=1 Tax=Methanobrevibacter olleyae TaxID=294671 RepID=A0A126QZ45_METOL|nr:phosphatase PAP2 family protein [Methanobrevibacter olleyae]AMK14655.1 PAP2 superfamily protein [Methanobrevibacter olleyae]SFL54150.1 hypothetical protein SAMN02910297_01165 [Methanobrevibacter olleyae]